VADRAATLYASPPEHRYAVTVVHLHYKSIKILSCANSGFWGMFRHLFDCFGEEVEAQKFEKRLVVSRTTQSNSRVKILVVKRLMKLTTELGGRLGYL
jgi:ribulose-5-phosphate 4-epimerase/fuculose-1-phosphate aldolase